MSKIINNYLMDYFDSFSEEVLLRKYAKDILRGAALQRDIAVVKRCCAVLRSDSFLRFDLEAIARNCLATEEDCHDVLKCIVSIGLSPAQLWIFYRHLNSVHVGCLLILIEAGLRFDGTVFPFNVWQAVDNPLILAVHMLIADIPKSISFGYTSYTLSAAVLERFGCVITDVDDEDDFFDKKCKVDRCLGNAKCAMLMFGGFETLVALQCLDLPALVSLHILDCAAPLSVFLPVHLRYRFVTLIKHFQQ